MTRILVGVIVTAVCVASVDTAVAQSVPRVTGSRTNDRATLSLQSGTLQVIQQFTRDGFSLQLTDRGETVRFTGNLAGEVSIRRGGRQHGFSIRRPAPADQAAVEAVLIGSRTLPAFDRVMETPWAKAPVAAAFRSAHALVGVLRADQRPLATVASMAAASSPPQIVRARADGPDVCWSSYTRDVLQYTYDLEGCVAEARDSWFPLALGWCAYEYNIKTSLAAMWALDCYGLL